jgi:phosphate transport system ATP-binding protein
VATETGPERSRNTAGASAEPPYVLPGGREASRDPGPVTEDDEEEGVSLAMLDDSTAATPAVLPGAAINGLAAAAVPPQGRSEPTPSAGLASDAGPRNIAAAARPQAGRPETTPTASLRLAVQSLDAFFGDVRAVQSVSLELPDRFVTAVIGPSGCGKSTLLRCLNRMHETLPRARVSGHVFLDGQDIYARGVNATAVRQHIGMVFQRPTPFPTMSIRDNVAAGLHTLKSPPNRHRTDQIVEKALHRAALWDEVKDRLRESAVALSGGQQQRLCIARALAIEPEVLLLDEPTASLDPISTQKVEELVYELRRDMTVVIVTHNMQQAARVSDRTAFMLHGELVEVAPTNSLFTNPRDPRTEAYITGRFG